MTLAGMIIILKGIFPYMGLFKPRVENGIALNKTKFKFCQDTIEFAGLKITPSGISPSGKLLSSIKNFPTPTNMVYGLS